MNEELLKKLGELIEQAGNLSKNFVKAENALKNGDLAETQKYTKLGQDLLAVMVGDVFEETVEELKVETDDFADIDDIDTLEITKHLCSLVYFAGNLVGLVAENVTNAVADGVKLNLVKEINAINRLYQALFAN